MSAKVEGTLLKKSYISYRPRYFILEGSNLLYKNVKEDEKERNLMTLTTDSTVIEFAAKRAFQVTTGTKSWLMKSEDGSEDIVKNWVAAIRGVIVRLQQETTSPEAKEPEFRTVNVGGRDFILDSRYRDLKPLGSGAYGMVVSALDTQTGKRIAIKKCANLFVDPMDARKIAREIRIMSQLDHPNVVKCIDVLPPRSADFDDVYMVGELMDVDLHRAIYYGRQLSNEHIQFFMYQLLCGIRYYQSVGIVHRDLKPSNILVNSECDLKITDFGLSRQINDQLRDLTEYVVTRWYRAPEIMLSSCQYTKAVDVWSAGCIFAELLLRRPLFPGDNYRHVLRLITKVTGSVTNEDMWFVSNPNAKAYMHKLPRYPRVDFREAFPRATEAGADLLSKMLIFDYMKRISVDDALKHPFFADIRDPECEKVGDPSHFHWGDIDTCPLTKVNMQRIIMEDAARLNPANAEYLKEIEQKAVEAPRGAN